MKDDLGSQVRRFAEKMSHLLNATVTNGVRVSTLTTSSGHAVVGVHVGKLRPDPRPIPLAPAGGKALVYLYLAHYCELDPEGRYLTMTQSTMSLYTSAEMADDELLVGIDYVRDPTNQFPGSHLHVAGQRDDLDDIYLGDERKRRKLRDLHLPVGGKRFRPTLEDLLAFTITEEMVEPRDGWRAVIDEHRATWTQVQVKAAARRNPEDAAAALAEAGWTVTPPTDP